MNTAPTIVVNFLICASETGKFLIQKRSPDRLLFPDRWEIPGGHLESCESVADCIKRELAEELSMTLTKIIGKIHEFFWESLSPVRDEVYIITAEGQPTLESGKATEYRWINGSDANLLLKPDMTTSGPYQAITRAFDFIDGKCPILPLAPYAPGPRNCAQRLYQSARRPKAL